MVSSMGVLRDFAKAFKEGYEGDQPKPEPAPSRPQAVPLFAKHKGCINMPLLVHEGMTRGTVDVRETGRFQDVLSRRPAMARLEFDVKPVDKGAMPDGWGFGDGDMSVFLASGEHVGLLDKRRFDLLGGKPGRFYGFVEPPSYDFAEDLSIAHEFRVFLFKNYLDVKSESAGVIAFRI